MEGVSNGLQCSIEIPVARFNKDSLADDHGWDTASAGETLRFLRRVLVGLDVEFSPGDAMVFKACA